MRDLSSREIATYFSLKHQGEERSVKSIGSLEKSSDTTLLWSRSLEGCLRVERGTLVTAAEFEPELPAHPDVTYLFGEKSPRLMFARIANQFFMHLQPNDFENHVEEHRKNTKINIGENVFIGANVTIGDDTKILHHTSIFSDVTIGERCLINTNCSIGTSGLGFEYDGDEIVKFPQFGSVWIGDGVEIGACSTIRRGALDRTEIGDGTKIGSLCNVGHNCRVGRQCILTCGVILGGSTFLGNRVYMGINSSTRNKVAIADDVQVGMGAVVARDFPAGVTIVGIPAKELKPR